MKKILLLFALFISGVGLSQTTLTLGSGTTSSNQRGPFSRSDTGSNQTLSRVQLLYLASELSTISPNSVISQVNFDLGSTNILTATGDATLKIYMKNSSLANVVDNTLWTTVSTGSTLVGTYTFNLANNFPGAEGFVNFVLDTGFVYTGGSLEISTEWDSSTLTVIDNNFPNAYFTGDGSLKWHYSNTTHGSSIDRTGSSSQPSTLTIVNSSRVNTQLVHASADPSAVFSHSIGTGTSGSATRGPFQRSGNSSNSVFSRSNMVYTATELASLTSNALISSVDFDLNSTNIINATGDATLKIYMKNSSATEAVADGETWINVISGAVLVGSYTFNTSNNFPGTNGFYTFNLDTDFEYTGGSLEISVDWDCSGLTSTTGNPNELFTGDASLNWNWDNTTHVSLNYQTGSSSAPSSLNKASNRKTERANTKFTFKKITSSTWVGATEDWGTGSNWSSGFVPSEAVTVTIGSTANDPVISSSTGANTRDLTLTSAGLTIQSGGSLIVGGTPSGDITYNVAIADGNWHMVSSPVAGETYGGGTSWISDNNIKTGNNTDNRGIATYQNGTPDVTTGPWTYYSFSMGTETNFDSGIGYSMIANGSTNYSFTGTYPTLPVEPTITQNVNNWNLVGNPVPSYIDVAAFITANSANLGGAFQALYVYSSGSGYTGLTSGYIHPGQAFFVSSNTTSGPLSTTAAMLSHQTGVTFYKENKKTIELSISDGSATQQALINYENDGSLGLDIGSDIGKFNGVNIPLSIYTNLLESNENIAFEKQVLPDADYENMIVPVGVNALSGKEITFSATSLNLPDGVKVYLEDRMDNVFTNLDEENYTINLSEALNGTGRFFLHTSSKSALSVDDNLALNNISIYKANASTLRVVGLQQGKASIKIYNVLGKQILKSSFEANGVKDISLPNLSKGVYIVQLETTSGNLNKKIVLE